MRVTLQFAHAEGAAARSPLFALRLQYQLIALTLMAIWLITGNACADSLRIAVVLPASGPQLTLGREIKLAVELALDDARDRAGGDGRVSVSWIDDQCSSAGGLAAAQATTTAPEAIRASVVIGHACPSSAQAAGALYDKAGIVNITAGALPAREPQLHRFGSRHFRLPADGLQGAAIGAKLAAAGPEARVAIVRDRTLFAQTNMAPVITSLFAKGRAPVMTETYAGGEKDFSGLAQRIKAAGITHVALAAFPSEAALLVPDVRRLNPDVVIVATDQLAAPEFARLAGSAAVGIQVAMAPEAAAFPRAGHVAETLAAKGGKPSRAALASYAAIQVILAATDRTRADADSITKTISSGTFETILGPLSFDAAGSASLPSHVFYHWNGSTLVPPSNLD